MSKLYTLHHPKTTMWNRQLANPAGDGTFLFVDSTGHVRNVPPVIADKLSRAGFVLLGSDAGLIAFEARVPDYIRAAEAMRAADNLFGSAVVAALKGGCTLAELDQVLAKFSRADLVNLREIAQRHGGGDVAPESAQVNKPAQVPAPVRVQPPVPNVPPAPVAAVAVPETSGGEAEAAEAPADAAAEAPAIEGREPHPSDVMHWRLRIRVARALGAVLPEKDAAAAAHEFLLSQPADAVSNAIVAESIK